MFERAKNYKVFDPISPEYELANSIIQEAFEFISPDIIWFSHALDKTLPNLDEYDKLSGGAEGTTRIFREPVKIYGYVEISAVIQELEKLGVSQTEEINLIVNLSDIIARLGEHPKEGDVFRITYNKVNCKK